MPKIISYILTIIFSLIIVGISFWTYNQSSYHEKIRNNFYELSFTKPDRSSYSGERLSLVKGTVISDKPFMGKNNEPVVLEKYKEEINRKKTLEKWELVKDSDFFKVVPFKLAVEDKEAFVNPYGLDQGFIGSPQTETLPGTGEGTLKKSHWQIKPGDTVYILGVVDESSSDWIINNPGLQSSLLSFWDKEPYIITLMEPGEVIIKATETGRAILYISIALFLVGSFFLVTSVINILKTYRKEIEPNRQKS